jgi:hypothetical protein
MQALNTNAAASHRRDGFGPPVQGIGLAVSYIPTHVHHIGSLPISGMLEYGEDTHGNFVLEQPSADCDAAYRGEFYGTYQASCGELVTWHEEERTP